VRARGASKEAIYREAVQGCGWALERICAFPSRTCSLVMRERVPVPGASPSTSATVTLSTKAIASCVRLVTAGIAKRMLICHTKTFKGCEYCLHKDIVSLIETYLSIEHATWAETSRPS
jgi:hypothetical protein